MDCEADTRENVRTKQPILSLCGLGESKHLNAQRSDIVGPNDERGPRTILCVKLVEEIYNGATRGVTGKSGGIAGSIRDAKSKCKENISNGMHARS